jgi:uncharacterized protein (UPF0264 family)
MLASVTSVAEAQIAIDCGVDIIDLKNPASGVLGALPTDSVAEIVALVRGRCPVSATVGDIPMDAFSLGSAIKAMIGSGVDFVKVGLFPTRDMRDGILAISSYAKATRLVGVLFADQDLDFSLMPDLSRTGFAGVMLDTANKTDGNLRSHADDKKLEEFISRGKALGLLTGLAGSLQEADIPDIIRLRPDYLGFRSALCDASDRTGAINAGRVSNIRQQFRTGNLARHEIAAAL